MKNQSAFPHGDMEYGADESSGMTLRDYFAAKAMQGLIAASTKPDHAWCYRQADEMLKERAK